MGKYLVEGIKKIQKQYQQIGDIRGIGLHIGVEYVKDTGSKEPDVDLAVILRKEGLKNGAIFGLGGANRNVLKLKPPLIINRDEADQVLAILEKSMGAVIKQ